MLYTRRGLGGDSTGPEWPERLGEGEDRRVVTQTHRGPGGMVRGDVSVIIKQMGDIRIAYNVLIIGISPARAQARLCSAARTGSLADDGLSGWTQVETL